MPIDIPAIAQDIGADADTVFGRLYHHLDPLYGTQNEDGSRKSLFIAQPGTTKDRINFPLLEAALAGLWQQRPNRAPFAYSLEGTSLPMRGPQLRPRAASMQ